MCNDWGSRDSMLAHFCYDLSAVAKTIFSKSSEGQTQQTVEETMQGRMRKIVPHKERLVARDKGRKSRDQHSKNGSQQPLRTKGHAR
jgi:hypothetical protein